MNRRLSGYFVFFYLTLAASLFLLQSRILYQPSHEVISVGQATQLGLSHWPNQDDFQGFISNADPNPKLGTLLVLHGNAGAAFHRAYIADALSRLGYRVVLGEYPGYGGRSGKPSEAILVADAVASLAQIDADYGGPIYLWGESLGAGVAAAVANQSEIAVDGMVLFFPWDSLPNLAQERLWYLPAKWLVLDQFDNVENLKGYEGKVAVVLAENDEIVPAKLGQALYASITGEKQIWIFEDASHNQFPYEADKGWWAEVMEFLGS